MAFVAWPDGAMGICQWSCGLGTWTNRLAFRKAGFNYDDMAVLSNSLNAGIRTSFKNLLADTVTFYGWDIIDMRAFGAQAYITAYGGAAGLNINEVLPPSVCVGLTLRTPLRGRAFRGRQYVAGLAEDQIDAGIWDAAATAEVADQWGAWQEIAQNVGWDLCIPTTQINKVPQSPAVLTTVTSMEVRSGIPAHQRRRDRRP